MKFGEFKMFKNTREKTKENFVKIFEKFPPNLRLAISGIVLSLFAIPNAKTQSSISIDRHWLQQYMDSDYYTKLLKKEILLLKTTDFAALENSDSEGLDTLLKVDPDRILQNDYVLSRTLINFLEKRKDQLMNDGIIDPNLLLEMYDKNTLGVTDFIIKKRTTERENTSRFLILLTEFRFLLSKKGFFDYEKQSNFTEEDLNKIKLRFNSDKELHDIYIKIIQTLNGKEDDLMFFMNTVAGVEDLYIPDSIRMVQDAENIKQMG